MIPPAVILVRPQEEGNVGATARAMANMGLSELVLVEPGVELGATARAFAVGASDLLDGCRRVGSLQEAIAPFARLVGTTSARARALGGDTSPRELPGLLAADPPGTRAALVFGPESSGLTHAELELCSPIVRIPAALRQPTLNLAQAVLVLSWEIFQQSSAPGSGAAEAEGLAGAPRSVMRAERPATVVADGSVAPVGGPFAGGRERPSELATAGELDGLFSQLVPLLGRIGFARDTSFPGVVGELRQLAARAGLRTREVVLLRGICRRAGNRLDRCGPGEDGDRPRS